MSNNSFEYNRPAAGPATIGVLPSETDQPAEPSGTVPQVGNHRRNDPFGDMEIVWVPVDEIETAPRRVRRALDSQVKAVKASIERYGNRVPILVHRKGTSTGYTVIDGHSRLEAAKLLGVEQVPVIVIADLPDIELRRLALSLNKLQETGQWDAEALRLEISEIIEIDGDLDLPGFEMPEVEAIRFGGGEGADPSDDLDKMPPLGTSPVTRPGDRWILGDHELRCGSAREVPGANAADGVSAVDVIFTDPPYNVKINGHVRGASAGFAEFAEASGELTDAAFRDFLVETLGGAVAELKPGGVAFVCMDWRVLSD